MWGKLTSYGIALLIILILNFSLPRLMPGDPLMAIYGEEALLRMTPELKSYLIEKLGLNQPLWKQLLIYFLLLCRGDLGYSFYRNEPVLRVIMAHLPWTLLLVGMGMMLAAGLGVIAGVEAGWRCGGKFDRSMLVAMMAGSGLPGFFVGAVLLITFGLCLKLLPIQGALTPFSDLSGLRLLFDLLKHLSLPLATLLIVFTPPDFLITRSSVVCNIKEPFVLTAKAKGLSDLRVRYIHIGRCSTLPVITRIGVSFGTRIIAGALFVEMVFSYPGMGVLIRDSLLMRDYPVLQGALLLMALLVLTVNFSVDLIYRKLDPRVRHV